MSDRDDDSNPMHKIGYGRGDDNEPPKPRKTQAYSFVAPDRIVDVGGKKVLEKTAPMEAVDEKPLTVKDVVNDLVAVSQQAWMALPANIRDALLDRPQLFKLIPDNKLHYNTPPKLVYNGVVLVCENGRWMLDKIILP